MKNYRMNWRIISIAISVIPFLIISLQFDISIEDILTVSVIPFFTSLIFMMIRLIIQGIKFNYLVKKFLGNIGSPLQIILIRMGSEFVTLTTPMFIGGEIVRIAWLKKNRVDTSNASWVTILEIVTDVLAVSIFAIFAGILAFLNNSILIGTLIFVTTIPILSIWTILFFFSSKKTFSVPNIISDITIKLMKQKGTKYIDKTNQWIEDICTLSKNNFKTNKTKNAFIISLSLSFLAWSFYGISFIFIADDLGYSVSFIDSILAVMAANAIGNVPITVGGSGLAELGIWGYLENLETLTFDLPENKLWNAIIIWRISTYHVPIAITWVVLIKLALRSTKSDTQ